MCINFFKHHPCREGCCISTKVWRRTDKIKHGSRPEHQLRRNAVDQLFFYPGAYSGNNDYHRGSMEVLRHFKLKEKGQFKLEERIPLPHPQSLSLGTSQVVQWLRLHASNAGVTGSIPGQGTKKLHAFQSGQKEKKKVFEFNLSL